MDITIGKNDWLYYRNFLTIKSALETPIHFSDKLKRQWMYGFEKVHNFSQKFEGTSLFYIAPDKEVIYPEYLPENIHVAEHRTIHELSQLLPAKVIYPYNELVKNKIISDVYYNRDTHWNLFGQLVGINYLAEQLKIGRTIDFELSSAVQSLFYGDLELDKSEKPKNRYLHCHFKRSAKCIWRNRLTGFGNVSIWENTVTSVNVV